MLSTDGALWGFGRNGGGSWGSIGAPLQSGSPGRIGTGTDWSTLATGAEQTVAIKTDGTLWSTTDGSDFHQIGSATNWATVSARGYDTFAIRTDGTLWAWGFNATGSLGTGDTTDPVGADADRHHDQLGRSRDERPTHGGNEDRWNVVGLGRQ